MYAINKFARTTWEFIASLGKVQNVEARDSHYVEVSYEYLNTGGIAFFNNNPDTTFSNGFVTLAGFSVSFNSTDPKEMDIRESLLSLSHTVTHVTKMAKMDMYHLQGVMKCDLDNLKYDHERGSYAITDGVSTFVFYGTDLKNTWAEALVATSDEYYKRLAMHRVLWFRWLKDAEFKEHKSGDLFKFSNGLSVKFDNKDEQISESNIRLYCETYDHNEEINRFETEEDFLVWLTKYF